MPAVGGVSASQVTSLTSTTGYLKPWLRQATTSTVDPGGLNLTTTTYEPAGSGYLRRTGRYLPAATAAGALSDLTGTT